MTCPAAAAAVARITEVTGAAPVLLTGDNIRAARRLAAQVGIHDVRAASCREKRPGP
jgi:cation-transporting P-type ATPase J